MQKLHKRLAVVGLAGVLALSNLATALAADMSPGNYVFAMALRACGVSPGEKVGVWQGAYEGYLEKTGNKALLGQLKGYAELSWGSTAQGVDELYWSVREWLSSATVKESGTDSCLYELPSSPAPEFNIPPEPGVSSIHKTPFSHLAPLSGADAGNYEYLFSDVSNGYWWNSSNPSVHYPGYYQRNVYVPKGIEVFGIVVSCYNYEDKVRVEYFTPDSSSSTGYRSVNVKSVQNFYKFVDHSLSGNANVISTWNWNGSPPCSVMNYPFKVFATAKDAENYCKTGTVSNLFTTDSITLLSGGTNHGADFEIIKRKVVSIDSQMSLPADATAAGVSLGAVSAPLDWKSLSASLGTGGLQIEYDSALETEPPDSMVIGAVSSFTDTILQTLLSLLPWGLLVFAIVVLVFLFLKIYKRMTQNA